MSFSRIIIRLVATAERQGLCVSDIVHYLDSGKVVKLQEFHERVALNAPMQKGCERKLGRLYLVSYQPLQSQICNQRVVGDLSHILNTLSVDILPIILLTPKFRFGG